MLKEYLFNQKSNFTCWHSNIPGVQICNFVLCQAERNASVSIPVCGEKLHFEVLFCLKGRLVIETFSHDLCAVEAPGAFLLSDSTRLCNCLCSGDLRGIFVSVDAVSAKESLRAICASLRIELNTKAVRDRMAANGYITMSGTPWIRAFFEIMKLLPDDARERYCVFKSVELLYLLCYNTATDELKCENRVISREMVKIRNYMQEHLSEKITIQLLCRKFLVSSTFLKENFRRTYGMPVHTWLVQQRIKRAEELLCTTRMPIQEIAQAVGYESISQFHTVFKEYYEMTPGQYRKMSETAVLRPFWQ